jgi:prolipoprotein diacylglyceryltransferase
MDERPLERESATRRNGQHTARVVVVLIAAPVLGARLGWVVAHWPRRHRDT